MCYRLLIYSIIIGFLPICLQAQGNIQNSNGTGLGAIIADAPTRIGSIDGPLAGPNIYAQVFAGLQQDSLQPVLWYDDHGIDENGDPTGIANMTARIPFIPESSGGFVQAGVWDASIWGIEINEVPKNQIGFTEIVEFSPRVGNPPIGVRFQQTAIVPAIPEPETWALLLTAGTILIMRCRRITACSQ